MRILFTDFTLPHLLKDSQYPIGGFAVQLNNWLTCLSQYGKSIGVLTFKGANKYVNKKLTFDLIDTYDPKRGIKIAKYFYYFLPELIKESKKFQPDCIVQACAGLNTGMMAYVSKKLDVPFIYRVANDMDVDERCNTRLKKYEQWAYQYGLNSAAAIICQNSYQYEHLKRKFPLKPMVIIHNPFNVAKVNKQIKSKDDRAYIAWLGVFSKQKNLPLLLMIAKSCPETNFRIAGMPASSIDSETKDALIELEKLPNVEFEGYVKRENVLTFLSSATALLSTSLYEGFSNTFLESFAAGTPVISPARVDPDQIISRYGLGLTSNNDLGLAQLVTDIENIPSDEYFELADKCHYFLVNNFSPEKKAEELLSFLQGIVE